MRLITTKTDLFMSGVKKIALLVVISLVLSISTNIISLKIINEWYFGEAYKYSNNCMTQKFEIILGKNNNLGTEIMIEWLERNLFLKSKTKSELEGAVEKYCHHFLQWYYMPQLILSMNDEISTELIRTELTPHQLALLRITGNFLAVIFSMMILWGGLFFFKRKNEGWFRLLVLITVGLSISAFVSNHTNLFASKSTLALSWPATVIGGIWLCYIIIYWIIDGFKSEKTKCK